MSRNVVVYWLKTNKGFILAEVLLAIFIISIALVAISGMFTQAIQANLMAKDYTVAANLAQKQLELLKSHPPEYWAGLTLPCTIPWSDTIQLPPPRYILITNASISDADDSLVEVTVVVSWQEKGREGNLQFVTLYSAL